MMADLGVEVTVIEALDQILTGCDSDAARVVARSFRKRGITVHTFRSGPRPFGRPFRVAHDLR